MWNRGKLVIVAILAVALLAAAFSGWYRYRAQRRALDFWGSTSAELISKAPNVELLALGGAGPTVDGDSGNESDGDEADRPHAVEFGDQAWQIVGSEEGQAAPGIKNIRAALLLDTTFDWNASVNSEEPVWEYALGFNDNRNWATVLFDLETAQIALTGGKHTARLHPDANSELRKFFAEHFPAEPAAATPPAGESETPAPEAAAPGEPAVEPPAASAEAK